MPLTAIIISSHHFFEIKTQGHRDIIGLKFRLLQHENKDVDLEWLRIDAIETKFTIIRLLLAYAAISGRKILNVDLKSAFLQEQSFNRKL